MCLRTDMEVFVLILSRKKNETFHILVNDLDIVVSVVDIRGDKTRLGIDAPQEVKVYRAEVLKAIRKEIRENQDVISTVANSGTTTKHTRVEGTTPVRSGSRRTTSDVRRE